MASLSQINIRFNADLKDFSRQMDNASRQMKKIGGQFKNVGTALTVGLTAPITALGIKSFNVFASFEDQLAKVKAISGATGDEFSLLKKNAEELGATTRFTASQVAELQLNLSKLGFNPTEILATTKAVTSLAIATGEDLGNSATVAASTLRGFQLDVSQTGRVVDVMAKSFSSSALDLEKFSVAMAILAPVANAAGVSIEDATAQLSVLVNSGIDASTAGTGLRNIFLDIAEKGITLEQALNKINSSSNQNVTALQLFGKRGATVATVLAKNISAANELANSYRDSAGAAEAMAKIMDDTAAGSMARLKSAFESFFIAIGEELAPVVRRFADAISEVVSKFQNLSPATKRLVVILGGLLAALGPVLGIIGYMGTNVVPGLIKAFGVLRAAIIALNTVIVANPYTALAAAIGIVVAALFAFRNSAEDASKTQTLLSQVSEKAQRSIAGEKAKLEELLYIARDEQVSKEQRLKAIQELNKLSPEYLGNLTLEKINTDEARKAIEKYNEALLKTATVKAAQEKLQDIQSKIIDAEIAASKSRLKQLKDENLEERLRQIAIRDGITLDQARLNFQEALKKGTDLRIQGLKDEATQLLEIIKNNDAFNISLTTTTKKAGEATRAVAGLINTIISAPEDSMAFLKDSGVLLDKYVGNFNEAAVKAQYVAKVFQEQIGPAIQDAAANIAVGMGGILAGIATGTAGVADIGKLMLTTMGDLMIQLGKIAIQTAVGILAIKKAFESLNPAIALAAGVALIAFGSIIKSKVSETPRQVALANGGVVFGETLSLVGDNRNAAFDPEVVSPLSKLKDFIDPGRGAEEITVNVIGDVKGDDIKLIVDRVTRKQLRRG